MVGCRSESSAVGSYAYDGRIMGVIRYMCVYGWQLQMPLDRN
jgi:hypothetical protein